MLRERQETRTKIDTYVSAYERIWSGFDDLFAGLSSSDWQKRHGADWIFADLPYHLSYFDQQVMVDFISKGRAIPQSERWLMPSLNSINAWNARNFARKPADQTVGQSLSLMRSTRATLGDILATKSDTGLAAPIWSPFFGWTTLDAGIGAGLAHTWNHFMELRLRLGRREPELPVEINRMALGFYSALFEAFGSVDAAGGRPFTLVLDFVDAGSWTITVAATGVQRSSGVADHADLVMSMEPDSFVAMLTKAKNPMVLMLTRKIRVRGFRNMGRFGKIFPEPAGDQNVFPVNETEPAPS